VFMIWPMIIQSLDSGSGEEASSEFLTAF